MRRTLATASSVILLVAALIPPAQGEAQTDRTHLERPSEQVLDALHAAFARGRALVSVWGASHVVSDELVGALRARLVARYGDGGPGQLFPARPLALYARQDVDVEDGRGFRGLSTRGHRVRDRFGRAGIALEARGTAHACARLHAPVTQLEAWARTQPGGGTLALDAGAERRTRATEGRLGWDRLRLTPSAPVSEVCLEALGDGPVTSYGVVATRVTGVTVEGFGVPGARAEDVLLWDEDDFVSQLAARPPDLFVLSYGTNESARGRSSASLRDDLTQVLARFRRGAPEASCLVIGPSDRPMERGGAWIARPGSTRVRDAYRAAALAGGCAFFDLLAWTGGPGSMHGWVERGLALGDHVHFTSEGYARLGAALAEELMPAE
ncbi:MAG: GDSL-type esterase/lipase family protein [Sandaracinus sp.]